MDQTLTQAFKDGLLSHPMEGEANSVDLFRTMALLSGANLFAETPPMKRLRSVIGHHDHYLFVLVDGLGMNLRDQFPAGGFFESGLATEIRSVYPSTTSVALTSLATGLWPAQHGLTGWWTHFPEYRRVIAPLPFIERGTSIPGQDLGLSVAELINGKPMVGSFFRDPASFLPRQITGSEYEAWSQCGTPVLAWRNDGHLKRLIRRDFRSLKGPSYRYLYIFTVDSLCHKFGTRSPEVAKDVERVDRLLARIRDALPAGVRMIVTADHGLVDVPQDAFVSLRHNDPLCEHLLGGQSGEGRSPVFHVRNGHVDSFLKEFESSDASKYFTLNKPAYLAEGGLYGPDGLSEPAVSHLGDFVGISTVPARFEYVPEGQDPVPHIGVHGGLLPEEMVVPLIVA